MLVNVADDENRFPWIHIFASVLAWASSVVNPFIYAASNRTYRVAYYKLFSIMKFWGNPLTPMASKSFVPSKGSKDVSQQQQNAGGSSDGGAVAVTAQNTNSSTLMGYKSGNFLLPV